MGDKNTALDVEIKSKEILKFAKYVIDTAKKEVVGGCRVAPRRV